MKKIDLKKILRYPKLSISIYLTILTTLIIAITSIGFVFITLMSVNNFAGQYRSEIYGLRTSLSTILAQALTLDIKRKDFEETDKIIEILKDNNMLSYAYVKDNKSGKIILGQDKNTPRNDNAVRTMIDNKTKIVDKYTIYYGIFDEDKMNDYSSNFIETVFNIMLLCLALGFCASVIVSNFISEPLKKLSDAAKKIASKNFNIKINNSIFLEIDNLVFSYNEMGSQLSELYSSLEQKVQERTSALEDANVKLKETQAMMVHSEKMRSLGELVAGIAHEINNPVNFIHGNIMIMQNYADDLMRLIDLYEENNVNFPDDIKAKIKSLRDEIDLEFLKTDIHDLIRSCIEGTQRTKNIVLDLKNFSRMEEMVLTQFDIPKEIDTTLNILNNKYKNRITVIKNYSQDTPKIEAYGGQLNQVFMNILDNAQDAMAQTGTLTINTYKVGENVKIEFIDTGSGIPKENLKKVFDPFFTTKAVGKGTGLGMSISYRVINDHQGTIEVESEVGVGTKFTITLPIAHKEAKLLTDENNAVES